MLGKGKILISTIKRHHQRLLSLSRTQRSCQSPVLLRQDYTIMDTVLSAPRASYPDIVKLTEKNVQSGNVRDLKVVPGYYTVATDRGASQQFVRVDELN